MSNQFQTDLGYRGFTVIQHYALNSQLFRILRKEMSFFFTLRYDVCQRKNINSTIRCAQKIMLILQQKSNLKF